MGSLTPFAIKIAKPGRHADGDGLYLVVKPSGAKSWVLRVQEAGRRRELGLGSVDQVSLADARTKAREVAKVVRAGGDPAADRIAERKIPTFAEAARRCHAAQTTWTDWHAKQWLATLKKHAFPGIGDIRVDRVAAKDIAAALRRVWLDKPMTGQRVLQRIGAVIDFSIAHDWRTADNPLRSVRVLLPKRKIETEHYASVPYQACPDLMAQLLADPTSVPNALVAFSLLVAARPTEARLARWEEIDLDAGLWSLPASRMKGRVAHEVPLSTGALRVLANMRPVTDDDTTPLTGLVFPGPKGGVAWKLTGTDTLRALGFDYTAHGLRASFSTWAEEQTEVRKSIIEASIAHKNTDATEAAYKRGTFLDQRRQLMQRWSDFLLSPPAADNVVPLRREA